MQTKICGGGVNEARISSKRSHDGSFEGAGAVAAPLPRCHFHWFALHRHPDWHGHCTGSTYSAAYIRHTCIRWHFHLPFRHRHDETGR